MVAAEQFWVFSVLAVWLLQKSKVKIEFPQQLDDPNATVTNIIAGLKKLSIPTDFPPAKLKQGQGEVVCQTLHSLVDHVLKITKFSWKAPVIPKDEYKEEAEADDDAEVTKGSREQLAGNSANNSLHTIQESGKQPEKILDSTIDPTEWKLELERVQPFLKVSNPVETKDWRHHFQQMQQHDENIRQGFTQAKGQLDKLSKEMSVTLEKIQSREKYVNTQLDNLIQEYRRNQDKLAEVREKYNGSSGTITEYTNELARISEELDSVKSQMDERGTSMTDASPLVKIKQALSKLKTEIVQMNLRIGVVEHTLLSSKLTYRVMESKSELMF